ncbi:MAG: hypothetical protein ABF332_05695, partial [Akkermansiaceae bacterium]
LPSVYFSEENLAAEVISDADGDVSAILVSGLSELDDRGSFATRAEVEPSSQIEELPVSYQLYEAAHFH